MKPYLMVTSAVFGLIAVAHIWRIIAENPHLAVEPWYVLLTLAAAGLCLWALRLLWGSPKSRCALPALGVPASRWIGDCGKWVEDAPADISEVAV
jgi:hypothetical protein